LQFFNQFQKKSQISEGFQNILQISMYFEKFLEILKNF